MPETYPRGHYHPGTEKPYSRRDAARDGRLLVYICHLCRRTATFLAVDFLDLFDPDLPATQPPFRCSKCKTASYVEIKVRAPEAGDYGSLIVRRLSGVRRRLIWANVKLGDAPPPPGDRL